MKKFALKSEVGRLGEALAKRYLLKKGYAILAQNYYFEKGKRSGEIDIIAMNKGEIHFVEVKTKVIKGMQEKSPGLLEPPEISVTPLKLRKCNRTAEHYLRSTRRNALYHFDVIAVLYDKEQKKANIRYLPDVFY